MEKKILNVVLGGVINRKGEILLLKRKEDPHAGFWGLPGGQIEFGEYLEEAIIREIKEETNIDVEVVALRGLAHEILHKEKSDEKLAHFLLWICELRPSHFQAKESYEGQLKWFPLKTIAKYKSVLIPSDLLMIRRFFVKKAPPISFYKVKMIQTKAGYKIE